MEVTEHAIACALTVLYLRGGPNTNPLPRRGWPQIDRLIRRDEVALGSLETALRRAGHWLEAAIAGQPATLSEAEELVLTGRILPACSSAYPKRWIEVL